MKRLSKEKEQNIISLYKSGKSINDIYYQTQHNSMTIKSVLIRNNIELREKPNKKYEEYSPEELYDYYINHSIKEFKDKFGFGVTNEIYRYFGDRPKKHSKAFFHNVNKEEFQQLYNTMSTEELAEHYGITVATVRNTIYALRVKREGHLSRKKNVVVPRNFLEKQKEMVIYLSQKYTGEDIAKLLDKTPARISQIINGN